MRNFTRYSGTVGPLVRPTDRSSGLRKQPQNSITSPVLPRM